MINSHKEFIGEIQKFVDKFDLIKSFIYMKDADKILEEVQNSEPRVLTMGLSSMSVDFSDYNNIVRYDFVIADETIYDTDSILTSESENMFCITALSDYLNHIAETDIELTNINFITESFESNSYTSVTGSFEFIIKGSASYWKVMDSYSV